MAKREKPPGAVVVRASSLGRRCAGFGALVASLPDDATSTDATRAGTARHAEFARQLRDSADGRWPDGSITCGIDMAASMCAILGLPLLTSTTPRTLRVEHQLRATIGRGVLTGSPDAYWHEDSGNGRSRIRTAVVVDWKFGTAMHLPHIDDDLQMAAYALLVSSATKAHQVVVLRVRVDCGETDVLDLRDSMVRAHHFERVALAMGWHTENYPQLRVSEYCAGCLARTRCPAQRALASVPAELAAPMSVSIEAIDESTSDLTAEARAYSLASVALALAPARSILDRAEKILRDHVAQHGPITLDDGRSWGPSIRMRDVIADHPQLLAELASETTPDAAWAAAATTKTAVLRALQDGGHARQDALAMWQKWKDAGLVTLKASDSYGWRDE